MGCFASRAAPPLLSTASVQPLPSMPSLPPPPPRSNARGPPLTGYNSVSRRAAHVKAAPSGDASFLASYALERGSGGPQSVRVPAKLLQHTAFRHASSLWPLVQQQQHQHQHQHPQHHGAPSYMRPALSAALAQERAPAEGPEAPVFALLVPPALLQQVLVLLAEEHPAVSTRVRGQKRRGDGTLLALSFAFERCSLKQLSQALSVALPSAQHQGFWFGQLLQRLKEIAYEQRRAPPDADELHAPPRRGSISLVDAPLMPPPSPAPASAAGAGADAAPRHTARRASVMYLLDVHARADAAPMASYSMLHHRPYTYGVCALEGRAAAWDAPLEKLTFLHNQYTAPPAAAPFALSRWLVVGAPRALRFALYEYTFPGAAALADEPVLLDFRDVQRQLAADSADDARTDRHYAYWVCGVRWESETFHSLLAQIERFDEWRRPGEQALTGATEAEWAAFLAAFARAVEDPWLQDVPLSVAHACAVALQRTLLWRRGDLSPWSQHVLQRWLLYLSKHRFEIA